MYHSESDPNSKQKKMQILFFISVWKDAVCTLVDFWKMNGGESEECAFYLNIHTAMFFNLKTIWS